MLDAILTDKTLLSSNENGNENGSRNGNENGNENRNENWNGKTMSSKEDDNETMNQNNNNIIKQLNDDLNEIIDKSKPFEEQIESIRKVESLDEYYYISDYHDKELKFKIFQLRLAHLSNIVDTKLFKQIFGHTFETLANKLINTTNKEENQIIVIDINKNKEKLQQKYKAEPFYDYVIQPNDQHNNLIDAINLILDFNESIQLDLVWKYKNQRIKKLASDFNW